MEEAKTCEEISEQPNKKPKGKPDKQLSKGQNTKDKEKDQNPKVQVALSQTMNILVTLEEIVRDEQFVL